MSKKIRPSNNPDKDFDHTFFGRRSGRPLKKGRKDVLERLLPQIQITPENLDARLSKITANDSPLWIEVGFGAGEYLVEMVKHNPEHQFIGCEPFINGVAQCLKSFDESDLADTDYMPRTHIWTDSAEILLDSLPDQCAERFYLLNPDPWPKLRHHKRRFIRPETLDRIARILKPGGIFITATDVSALAEWMLEKTLQHDHFEWTAHSKSDWQDRPDDWMITTRYAEKGAQQGRDEVYLRFKRKDIV